MTTLVPQTYSGPPSEETNSRHAREQAAVRETNDPTPPSRDRPPPRKARRERPHLDQNQVAQLTGRTLPRKTSPRQRTPCVFASRMALAGGGKTPAPRVPPSGCRHEDPDPCEVGLGQSEVPTTKVLATFKRVEPRSIGQPSPQPKPRPRTPLTPQQTQPAPGGVRPPAVRVLRDNEETPLKTNRGHPTAPTSLVGPQNPGNSLSTNREVWWVGPNHRFLPGKRCPPKKEKTAIS